MANDWNNPTNSSLYTAILGLLRDRDSALGKMVFAGDSNIPAGFMGIAEAPNRLQKYSGAAWVNWEIQAEGIADGAITTGKIYSGSVTEDKLGSGAVTINKLGSNAVSTAKFRGANNAWLRWRNAAGDSDINVLLVDNMDHTKLSAATGKLLYLAIGNSGRWCLDGGDTTNYPFRPGVDNTYDLGNASYRVRRLYLGRGVYRDRLVISLTGTTQSGAASLQCGFNFVTTSASNYCGKLPAALEGDEAYIYSNDNNTNMPKIYPATNEYMNETKNGYALHGAGYLAHFYCYQDGRWAASIPNG